MAKTKDLQFCVIGLGAYGFSLAKHLAEQDAYVLAIDNRQENIEEIQFYASEAVCLDATDPDLLEEHGVTKADTVIIAIGEFFEPVVLIAMELLNAGVPNVIARAGSRTQEIILNRIGVHKVIHPEEDEGKRMARSLLRTSISSYFELTEDLGVYEIDAPEDLCGYTLNDIKLRNTYNVNLLTIKRLINEQNKNNTGENDKDENDTDLKYKTLGVLRGNTQIMENDKLVVMGEQKDIDRLLDINE